jgi:hypothetical protein
MSDPLAERLSRFTPDAGRLDRDALLFAAGRASARPGRRWQALAGVLALSQLATLLLFLWPHTPNQGVAAPRSPVAPPPVAGQPPPAQPGTWAANWRVPDRPDEIPQPPAADSLVPDDPPLRAFGAPPALVN